MNKQVPPDNAVHAICQKPTESQKHVSAKFKETAQNVRDTKKNSDDSRKHEAATNRYQDATAEFQALDRVKYSLQQQSAKKVVKAPQSNMLASPTDL